MNKKIIFVSDFFSNQISGGAELNDDEIIKHFLNKTEVKRIQSHEVDQKFLRDNKECFFIISNFCNLSFQAREILTEELEYIIYEHDHKYLKTRNPAQHENFKANLSKIVNYFFYKNAKKIFCQSSFHEEILRSNLEDLDNITNVGGNLWSLETLNKIKELSLMKKTNKCSIMDSSIPHKNTVKAIEYCKAVGAGYDLIQDNNHVSFLSKMAANDKFVFFPGTPETLSRLVVESRMLGMKVITNDLVGATKEEWFSLKGDELIEYMKAKRSQIFTMLADVIEKEYDTKHKPLISILSTFYEGEEFLEGFLKNITNQTIFDKCELVLVDTASPGKEAKIVKKYTKKYSNIKYIRFNERYTPSKGMTIAIKNSSGKYLNFACIDDRKSKDSLEVLFNELDNNQNIDLVYGQVYQTHKANETFDDNSSNDIKFEHSLYEFSKENMVKCLPGPMPLWRKTMHEKCGFFIDSEEGGAAGNDWEMWLRAVDNGLVFKKLDKPVGLYMTGGRSQQENNTTQRRHEAKIFFKYSHIFGYNYKKFKPYFDQFRE